MLHELHDYVSTCEVLSTDTTITKENANKFIPVELNGFSESTGLQIVTVLTNQTNVANRNKPYGQFLTMGDDGLATIVSRGQRVNLARATTSPAVADADIGKGVRATAGTAGIVEAGASARVLATGEVGKIVGGNTVAGTAANPAYYTVEL